MSNKNVFVDMDWDALESTFAVSQYPNFIQPNRIRLKDYIKEIYVPEFSAEWKRNILDLIPRADRRKHSSFINTVLDEVKDMYIKNMKAFVLKSILSCKMYRREHVTCEECNVSAGSERNVVQENKIQDHAIFLQHRNLFAKRYFLSYPIIRHIMNTAYRVLPVLICDFRRYHELGILTLSCFQDMILEDIKRGSLAITNKFYTETFRAVQKSKLLRSVSAKRRSQFMRCLTNVFVQQILSVMMKSIDHVTDTMKDGRFCPQIEFQLVCESDQLVTKPNVEEVFSTYHNIIRHIEGIAQDLLPLDEWLNVRARERYIKIALPDWFVEKSHQNLQEILDALFQPMNEHIALIFMEFSGICASSAKNRILSLTAERPNFDAYFEQIYTYSEYLSKTNSMLSNLYYNVGKLEQSSAKESLRQICCNVINILTTELVKYHQDFNRSICADFEDLKSAALDIPRDANSLIQLSERMSRASKVLIKEQEQKIRESVYMLSKLLEITILTDEHIDLNKTTINWLHDIQPVFAQNNTLCEAMKSELEEDLQRRINALNSEVDAMFPQLVILDDMDDVSKVGEYAEYYEELIKRYKRMDDEMQVINSEERLFKFPETEFPKIIELKETIVPFYKLICTIHQWRRDNSVWLNGPFECLDATVIEKKTVNYLDEITDMNKTMKSRIKMDATANKSYKFSGIADDPDPMQQPAPLKLCWQTLNNINEFKVYVPLAVCMCNPALNARHWKEMSAICNFDLTPNAGTTLKKMINMNLMDNIEKYKAISLGANKELRLQQELAEMLKQWEPISFEMSTDAESGMVSFKHANDIEILLSEHLIKIGEMRASHFVKPILSDLMDFLAVLARIQETLDQWTRVQYRKLYLEPIFSYPGIEIHLSQETSLYLEATNTLLDINNRFRENPKFHEIKKSSDLLQILNKANEKLEKASKGVKDYLDIKRLSFTRFFFLEDSEVQKILFESIDTGKQHTLMKKCFAGVERLKFNKSNCIRGIIGHYGEILYLSNNISLSTDTGCEEQWLIQLEKDMKDAVHKNILQYHSSTDENSAFVPIDNFPSMAIVCSLQLYWTCSVEKCLTPLNVTMLNSLLTTYTNGIISITNELKNELTRRRRNLLTSLIGITLTHKEIIRLLLDRNIVKQTDFEWIAQLRYYCNDKIVEVSVFNTTVKYGYEYSYYQQNIVNTPLTDRCFRTVLQAYRYHLYSSVVGPTGTGKTETIKSLTRAIAKPCYVVNCSSSTSYDCVIRTFKGVIACGAWICLENFDRLRLELLSAIAQNLTQMKQAISSNSKIVSFEGCNLNLNVSGNVCVNINSERSGYADLPDNLKVLFRSVSLMAPDIDKIAEVELFAGGFLHAKNLAMKLTVSYRLLSEHLGEKHHYDFGTSSVKTVIATAINTKRNISDEDEYTLLLRSMIHINIPQLCNTDIPIFQSIMHDVFPESVVLPFDCSAILTALESVCAKRLLTLHTIFKLKAVQIVELMYIRRGLILISNPLGGKTEILHTLAETLSLLHDEKNKIGATVKLKTVMPGVVNSDALFGYFCDKSGMWKDGLCTTIFRRFTEDTSTDRKWLVFDGDLSGTWMENLYTILDENKMLYLTSGERFPTADSTSIIFETTSTMEISPSVISRCGIIYIDAHSIGWRPYVLSHIAKPFYDGYNKILYALFDWAIDPCLNYLRENGDILLDQELHLVTSTVNLFEILLRDACEDVAGKENHFAIWAQAALILAIVWGLGGNLIEDSRARFNAFCVSFWNGTEKEHPKPDMIKHFDVTLPNEGLIQDNFYIFKGAGNWKYWGDLLKNEKIPEICSFNQIYIPNINSMKYNHIFLKHIKYRKPFLLYGDVAVGKTSIMHDLLRNKLPENCLSNFFSFTSMITVTRTQRLLFSKLNKIRRTAYGPGRNQFCVNFVDDVNTIIVQKPEAQSVFDLLRQLLSYNYCYDTNELNKVFVQDIMFTLAVTAGKLDGSVPPRLLRHFNTYAIPAPASDNIFRTYFNVLLANLKKNLFAADVTGSVTSIVNATVDVYKSVMKTLRPVPSKLYYYFDMRDVSRVISGCGLIQKESVETKITFIRLWVHEVLRVFNDRMLDEGDKEWLFLRIRDAVKSNFKDSFEIAFDHLPKFENQITKDSFGDLMFGNFMDMEKDGRCRRYEEINSMEALRNKVLAYLDEYNAGFKRKINVVVCRYLLESLIKVSRILSTPGGNLLMISTVGSGRKSTTALAAFMQQQTLFQTTIESYYDTEAWRDELRAVLRECGALRKDVTYFINERQMKDAFLSDISCLLSTGELPDLFSTEDRQNIIEMTRLHAQGGDRNAELSARSVMSYFVDQCKNRLHFVLCFSPTSAAFRTYLCSYPNLAKHCTVNCYQIWPDQALLEIAVKHMRDVNVREEIKADAAKVCVQIHNSAKEINLKYREMFGRNIHVTSSAFLHMLKLYRQLTSKKQEKIVATRNRYIAGLEKLELAAEQVEQMKAILTILKPQLELSAQQTMITMKEVENENITVERATILVKQEEEIANKKAEIAGTLRTECEADLAVAIPILEDAVIALNTLKPTDITLVKAMKNPPDTIKLVMAAVCVMLGVPPDRTIDPVTGKKFTDYWGPSKRILGDMNFLQNLKDYDKDDIAPAVMQIIKKTYMTDNSFMPHIVAKASSAAEGLCKWVRAMESYDEVAKVVAPKKKKLAEAQMECDEAEAFLNEKRQTLAALNAKLAALHDSLRQTLQKKLNLETEVATCTAKLIKAEKLIASLGGEKSHWMQCAHNLQINYDNLVGDMLLSCGIVAYMAPYNTSFRDEMLIKWKEFMEASKIQYTKTYDFVNVLGVEIEINHWQLCGLSNNRFATENAIILNNSEQWCLFIDSQNQINQWIKKMEKKNDLKIVKLTDPDYISVIERNIETGTPVLLENVGETLEIALEPILLKNIYKDEDWYIDIGTKSMRYSQNFRFYITTRLTNPNYTVDVFAKLTIIDFSMPDGTLRDKLLDIVISKEKPELQEKFEALRVQDATNKKVLQQQEDNILSTLSSTTTNILEDEKAIQILDSSKNLTVDIMRKQEAARTMTEDINRFRDAYLQFADHCAGLFCTLTTLSNLNYMYRFSFSWFIQLYITSIETSSRSVVLEKRLQFLKTSFTRNLHSSVCRSLFEKHKLLYSFLLCVKVLIDAQQTTQKEVEYFVSSDSRDCDAVVDFLDPMPDWLPMNKWRQICRLSSAVPNLRELANDFRANSVTWQKYCNAIPFQSHPIPSPWADSLTRFQKLMLIKIVRYDKIVVEIMRLIEDTMEDVFNSDPRLQISESYAESSCLTPIIFILPSYASPLSLVSAYASARGYTSKFVSLSMGDEQQANAEILVERARREGGWIFLQNCHHAASWLPRLERICENLNLSGTSLDFRLWLSSFATPDFPISILQSSVKLAYDYPLRLKQSLLRAYRSEPVGSKEFFEGCPGRDKEFSKLLYGLCFFHGVVRERRHFGPQGWNAPYDFDHMDFEISVRQLQSLINETENVPFGTLLYLIGECNYGGKITDRRDERCLRHLLDSFCDSRVIENVTEYSFSDCVEHSVPQRCEYRDIIRHISDMQLDASAEAFACDENALVTKDTAVAREFLESISLLDQIRSPDHEAVQDRALQAINEITSRLPALFNISEIQDRHPTNSREPLNAILIHEAELINKILSMIADSLSNLESALNGETVLTESLEELAKEICNNEVPCVWRLIDVGIATRRLPNYINLLSKRVDFVRRWRNSDDPPCVIHFDALSCCKRFLSAALLAFSRRRGVPVERVASHLRVANDDSTYGEGDEDAYYIRGLHLSGARWDTQRRALIESSTNVFWYDMPPICLVFSGEKRAEKRVDDVYECPVYISPMRCDGADADASMKNYITSVLLETDKPHVHWIKRGTALFCQVEK
ncbi:PREDICTED: dynein heavy chain 7, axonemal-like [Wasmannia auropunctata]|uniref:dynein heavy chain 7, axonemal-like n=1 Tax=Wasmannia auropunctata TaxID=64793 RepID=UPI0005F068C2|nr:PREDICTED: dynein heavy chain 7, axonemal-like [Wasmannia auropunctata]